MYNEGKYDLRLNSHLIPSNLWSFVQQWNSLKSNFSLMTKWARWLLHGTELMTYAETVSSWFQLNLKVVQVTWNMLYIFLKYFDFTTLWADFAKLLRNGCLKNFSLSLKYEHIPHPGKQGHYYLIDLKFGKVITGIRLLRTQNFRKLTVLFLEIWRHKARFFIIGFWLEQLLAFVIPLPPKKIWF